MAQKFDVCTCRTAAGTPAASHHKPDCQYRLMVEAAQILDGVPGGWPQVNTGETEIADTADTALDWKERALKAEAALQCSGASLLVVPDAQVSNKHRGGTQAYLATEYFNEGFNACRDAVLEGMTLAGAAQRKLNGWHFGEYHDGWLVTDPQGRVHVAHDKPSSDETERTLARLCQALAGSRATASTQVQSVLENEEHNG
ncbi:hypothetical protein F6X40_35515 [Paraburkholderia sp. UCT31]|uniref:hypothetical protein n=1 Tax=Paraburkholderia sp. UCT31 TaxID=2615209 RepID=UPI001655BAE9|nr:hypothetical protein [Paraburkholderia sp. UCT31]MBC8741859.1 hypothetical protein [Paraburkholderia sp. UCT31]